MSWPEVIKGVPNQGVVFCCQLEKVFVFVCYVSGVCSVLFACFFVVSISAID